MLCPVDAQLVVDDRFTTLGMSTVCAANGCSSPCGPVTTPATSAVVSASVVFVTFVLTVTTSPSIVTRGHVGSMWTAGPVSR